MLWCEFLYRDTVDSTPVCPSEPRVGRPHNSRCYEDWTTFEQPYQSRILSERPGQASKRSTRSPLLLLGLPLFGRFQRAAVIQGPQQKNPPFYRRPVQGALVTTSVGSALCGSG